MTPPAGWEARLVIGTAAVITGPEAVAVPNPRLPIPHHGGVRGTRPGARAEPGRLAPGVEGSGRAQPPDRAAADGPAPRPTRTSGQLSPRWATPRPGGLGYHRAGDGVDHRVLQRGQTGAVGPVLPRLPARRGREPSGGARAARRGGA